MKRYILLAVLLAACQPVDGDTDVSIDDEVLETESADLVQDNTVVLRLNKPVSEPRACIIPIRIENGLANPTSVTMIAFDLSGPGEAAKGNMFAPAAEPGGVSVARVIVEGQSCDAFDTITIPEIRCTSGEESCEDKVEFIGNADLRFSQAG